MKQTPIVFLSIFFACNTTEPPPPPHQSTISLSVEDASCTEAWLRVSLTDSNEPRTVAIQQDGQRVLTARLPGSDSLLVVEGLLPGRTYSFVALRLRDSTAIDASSAVQTTTMDTTSHNFAFHVDTLGVTSSVLYDVAIVSDTNIWAVGELYLNDSSGQLDPVRYNAAHWNGSTWTVVRIPYYYQGQPFYNPIQTVFAFGSGDIWFAGNGVIHWDGQQYVPMTIPSSVWGSSRINKVWGSSSSDLCIVGDNGSIAHYVSGTWQRIESGTQLDVYDIWGERNPQTGETEILALASNVFQNQGAKLLSIKENTATQMSDSGLTSGVNALWFCKGRRYYAVGPGIHQKRSLSDPVWSVYPPRLVTWYFSSDVRGTSSNDVFVAGSFREAVHFNGMTWRRYEELMPGSSGVFAAVATKGYLAVFVGFDSPYALTIIARR